MITLTQSVYAVSPALGGETAFALTDFAVGFSRQPLPKGRNFALVTNAGVPGIRATDATTRCGLDLISLRPEINESLKAKLLPTATISPWPHAHRVWPNQSFSARASAGYNIITNGVRQELFGMWLCGEELLS